MLTPVSPNPSVQTGVKASQSPQSHRVPLADAADLPGVKEELAPKAKVSPKRPAESNFLGHTYEEVIQMIKVDPGLDDVPIKDLLGMITNPMTFEQEFALRATWEMYRIRRQAATRIEARARERIGRDDEKNKRLRGRHVSDKESDLESESSSLSSRTLLPKRRKR